MHQIHICYRALFVCSPSSWDDVRGLCDHDSYPVKLTPVIICKDDWNKLANRNLGLVNFQKGILFYCTVSCPVVN